jgi:EKC/KEOPS complex subunit CGI121/TPRKB
VFSLSPNNNVCSPLRSRFPIPSNSLAHTLGFSCGDSFSVLILLCLDPRILQLTPTQIAESFRRFGITTSTTSLLIIKVSTPSSPASASEVQAHLASSIEGQQVPFEDSVLAEMTDVPRVKKIYKLNSGGGGGGAKRNGQVNGGIEGLSVNGMGMRNEDERKELENLVLGAMALRGVTN